MRSRCHSLLLAAFCALAVNSPTNGQFGDSSPLDDTFGRADRLPAPGSDDGRISRDLLQELRVAELLQDRGEDEKAIDAYRGVYGKLKKILEEDHRLLLHILDSVTDIRVGQGKPEEAEGPLTKVIALRERQLAENPDPGEAARMGAGLVKLGRIHGMTGKPEAAVEPLGRGRSLLEGLLGSSHELVIDIDRLVGEAAWDVGHFEEADEWLRRVLEARTGNLGEQSPAVATIRNEVGVLALVRERYADAAAVWSDVAAVAGPPDGRAGLEAIDRLRWLAVATALDGDLPEAAMIALRCRRAAEMRIGGTAADVACDLALLAMFLELAGRREEADSLFERFAVAQSSPEVPASHRCQQLRTVAAALIDRGLVDRAAAVLIWVLACDERRSGTSSFSVIDDKILIADCLLEAEDPTAAGRLLEEVLATSQRLLGNAHYKTIDTVVLLAAAAAARGDATAAAEAAEALVIRAPPLMNPQREAAMAELISAAAALVENGGQAERAAALRDGWLKLRGADSGDAATASADILVSFANAMVALGEVAKAIPFYERARDLRIKLRGPEHPTVAAVLLPLGRGYEAVGRIAESRESGRQGLAIWEATVGLEHPVTLAAVRSLASAHEAAGDLRSAGPLYERLLVECERRKGPVDLEVAGLLTKLAEYKAVLGDVATAESMLKRAIDIQALAAADPSAVSSAGGQDVRHTTVTSTSLEKARDIAMRANAPDSASDLLANLGAGRPEGYGLATLDQSGAAIVPSSLPPPEPRAEAKAASDAEKSESRQVEVTSVENDPRRGTEARLADMLLAMGDTRAAWPYVMAGLRSTSSDSLEAGEALVRAAIVEADAGRVRIAWGRLAEARGAVIKGFKAIAAREDTSPTAANIRTDDRRLFRLAIQYAEAALACGDPARATAAIRKTMSIPALVAAASLSDRDQALSLWMRAAAATGDLAAAQQAASELLKIRQQSFGPADLRSVTAEACQVAVEYRRAIASPAEAAARVVSIDTLRQMARKWLQTGEPATPDALTQGVADLIPIVISALAVSDGDDSATDRQFADALRDRTLSLAESLQATGQRSLSGLAAVAAAADPRPETAARAAAEGLREGPLVRPLAGIEAVDIRALQAAMLAAIGEESWKECLEEDAARAVAALAARQPASMSGRR